MGENQDVLGQLKQLALRDYSTADEFGVALYEAWVLKKKLAGDVTTPFTDKIYDKAMIAGAKGGKLLGAGGGGFVVFVVEPENQEDVRQALRLNQVDFKFDTEGSQVIYADN